MALAFHRSDLLVASTPFVVIATWSILTRPDGGVSVASSTGRAAVREGEATSFRCRVTTTPGAREVTMSLREHPWVQTRPRHGVQTVAVDPRQQVADLAVVTRMIRWGHHGFGLGVVGVTSSWGAFHWGPAVLDDRDVEVIPVAPVFDAHAPMPHPLGLIGVDRSVRPGDGSEFAGIRPFQLGDRLRRIHWPSSLRSRTLNVTATYADHDSQVVVVVDAASDLGGSGGIDGAPSTLDSTVRAAAALSEHYIRRGDRVGLQVAWSLIPIRVRPSAGRAHLRRMLSSLAEVRPGGVHEEHNEPRLRVDPRAVVLVCSPLISPATMQRVVSLASRGLTVVVIDTLPPDLVHLDSADKQDDAGTMLAWRIRMLERQADVRSVTRAGIPVVPWRGPGSLDQVLRELSRRARTPRMVHR